MNNIASNADRRSVVLAVSGASGAVYSVRLLQHLVASAIPVQLTISDAGCQVIQQELGLSVDVNNPAVDELLEYRFRDARLWKFLPRGKCRFINIRI